MRPAAQRASKRSLRAARRVGADPVVDGSADIGGGGDINIGDNFILQSHPVRSHIFASEGAAITVGNDVRIAYGAAIAALQSIEIGNDVVFGPFLVIMDNDFHQVGDRTAPGEAAPIRIGSNVTVGTRVTILRGSQIGSDVRIMSGSMVSGVIPNGVTIGGVPARVVVANGASEHTASLDMNGLVQNVLGLVERPEDDEGPAHIGAWDSLGTLRLLLTIEEQFGVTLTEDEVRAADSVSALEHAVRKKIPGGSRLTVDIAGLAQSVLGLRERPQLTDGPQQISAWDSLGTLRLLLAIEDSYGITLNETEMRAAATIEALSAIVDRKLKSPDK